MTDQLMTEVDQEPPLGDPHLEEKGLEHCRCIWWMLLDLDARLSFVFGRRPLMSSAQKVPRPSFKDLNPEEREVRESILDTSQLMLEVLNYMTSNSQGPDSSLEAKHSTMMQYLWRLQQIQAKIPTVPQHGTADPQFAIAVTGHQIEIELFSLVLNCQISRETFPDGHQSTPEEQDGPLWLERLHKFDWRSSRRHYDEVLLSVRAILDMFDHIHELDPSEPIESWTSYFGAACAAIALGAAQLRQDTPLQTDIERIEQILKVFRQIANRHSKSLVVPLAIQSLSSILVSIKEMDGLGQHGEVAGSPPDIHPSTEGVGDIRSTASRSRAVDKVTPSNLGMTPTRKRQSASRYRDDQKRDKRARHHGAPSTYEGPVQEGNPTWQPGHDQHLAPRAPAFSERSATSFHDQSTQSSFEQPHFPHGPSTSFTGNGQLEYSIPACGLAQPDGEHQYHSDLGWLHPPIQFHPPMWDGSLFAFNFDPTSSSHPTWEDPTQMTASSHHPLNSNVHADQDTMLGDIRPTHLFQPEPLPKSHATSAHIPGTGTPPAGAG